MEKLTKKSEIRMLCILAWVVYFSSYVTRINYSAVLVEVIQVEQVSKSSAAIITTVLFVTYGIGQLLSGYLGDRFSPWKMIFTGLTVAVVCNCVLPLVSPSIWVMAVVWGINGLAQAFMWPPLVKILTTALRNEDYAAIVPKVCTSSACATILIYLGSPLIIRLSGWKIVFYICAGIALTAAIIWHIAAKRLLKNIDFSRIPGKQEVNSLPRTRDAASPAYGILLVTVLVSIALQGMLRDGISTWTPSFISETFHLDSTSSILTGVTLPLIHMVFSLFTHRIIIAMKRNIFACIALLFSVTAGLLTLLYLFGINFIVLSLIFISFVSGTVHVINSLQLCYLPTILVRNRNISFMAGLLNSATYVGSALSTYLFAVISEFWGWDITIFSWILFAMAGLALTIFCIRLSRRNKSFSLHV